MKLNTTHLQPAASTARMHGSEPMSLLSHAGREPSTKEVSKALQHEKFRVDESDSAAAAAEDTDGRHNNETLQRKWQHKLGSKAS
eukprot:CAMPEP_0183552294 /NCGR_PEP_ID=MMETSP0371-20130417/70951_1 /TAXON_ID=268820 /ORGANISM="Peridinium aciculiferum, Strain PAER-2" /LENGTH=84 /DNA_ID=CAMNT_0025757209 /DNA_START=298 /DNA_END=553 /DNA_ORIENTATION=-